MNSPSLNTILLVDDDEISNLFNGIFIAKLNLEAEVDFVLNGQEALELLLANGKQSIALPCLLLLDIKMPIMDGWQFLQAFEAKISAGKRQKITIVMLTTSEDEADMVKAANSASIREYIHKPLSEKTIRRLIRKYYPNTAV